MQTTYSDSLVGSQPCHQKPNHKPQKKTISGKKSLKTINTAPFSSFLTLSPNFTPHFPALISVFGPSCLTWQFRTTRTLTV